MFNRPRYKICRGNGILFYVSWFMKVSLMKDIEQELKQKDRK